jgi:hypothetical protein
MAKRMNGVLGSVLGMLALGAILVRPVGAVPGPSLPVLGGPSSLSVGAFFPSSDKTKDAGGATQLAVDFHYMLPVPNPLNIPTRTMVNLGVEAGAKNGRHSTVIPLTISQVVAPSGGSPVGGGSPYIGVGVGVYVVNTSGLSASSKIGGFAQIGYNLTSMFFIDAKYQFVQDANGAVVSAGLRF